MNSDVLKERAAACALDFVSSGMRLGLGTGSTAAKFVDLVGARVAEGMELVCVPTSEATHQQAEGLGITLSTLDQLGALDLTVDGADEFDSEMRLIKGGGGALLREKIVAASSERMVVIADQSKKVETLGQFPLPVEIISFGWQATRSKIEQRSREVGCEGDIVLRRTAAEPFLTDGRHYILDCSFGKIPDPDALANALSHIPGVVEHGLFIGIASTVVYAAEGGIEIIGAQS